MKTVNTAQTVENYPYGYMKTKANFSLEFSPSKGFRSVFQTINPKNGRLNAPKKGTYSDIMYMTVVDGFVSIHKVGINGAKELNNAFKFLYENYDLYTKEQIKYIIDKMVVMCSVDFNGCVTWAGADPKEIGNFYVSEIKKLKDILNTGINKFNTVSLDIDSIESKKPIGFSPFKTVKQ